MNIQNDKSVVRIFNQIQEVEEKTIGQGSLGAGVNQKVNARFDLLLQNILNFKYIMVEIIRIIGYYIL